MPAGACCSSASAPASGSALVAEGVLVPLELAHLPYRTGAPTRTTSACAASNGSAGGSGRITSTWSIELLKPALQADYVVLGGGQTKKLKTLPPGVRLGDNHDAILGGLRLWDEPSQRERRTLVTRSGRLVPQPKKG